MNDFLEGNVFEHFKNFFLDNSESKCEQNTLDIFKRMLVYLNYMKVVTEDIALMCPVPTTFEITSIKDDRHRGYINELTELLKAMNWEQEFSDIVRDLETKGDVFYQIYEKDNGHYTEKLDTLKMIDICYEDGLPLYYVYECEVVDSVFNEGNGNIEKIHKIRRFTFTKGGYYLQDYTSDDGSNIGTPIFYKNSDLMGDMIPIIHIKSVESRNDNFFSKIPAVDYIDPILYLMAVDTDRRATNRQAGFPRIFIINGEVDENSSYDPGGIVYVNSIKDYTTSTQPEVAVKSIEITNSLSSIKQELDYVSDWLHRSVGLIPPTLQLKMSSSDSSKAIAQFRIKQEVKNKKYIQNVRDSFSKYFVLKLKEKYPKTKVKEIFLEVPKLLTTTSAFDTNLLIAQEMAIGLTTVKDELIKRGMTLEEVEKHLKDVNNEVFQASGKDVAILPNEEGSKNVTNNSNEIKKIDNNMKK